MLVALDTNILVQDFWLDSPHSKVFLEELNVIPATLHIPEIVIDETVNKYREFLTEKIEEQKKISIDIARLTRREVEKKKVDIEQITKEYKAYLEKKLQSANVQILPYPKIEHRDVVQRILERRRPFKKGDSGYRDFLIWETIKRLELWGTEEIVFITNNTKDFGESGYLSDEFTDKRTGNKNFRIVVAITKFNEQYILPRLKKLDELKSQLIKGHAHNFDFKNWLDTEFTELIRETELEEVLTGFPYGVGRVRVREILMFEDYKINEVKQLDSGEKFVQFLIRCKVNASVDIDWRDYVNHVEVREYFGEGEEEFGSSASMISEDIKVAGYLLLDKHNQEVNSVEITLIEGPLGSIEMGV